MNQTPAKSVTKPLTSQSAAKKSPAQDGPPALGKSEGSIPVYSLESKPVPPGYIRLNVNILAPSFSVLLGWMREYAFWAKESRDPKTEPKCEIAKEPTQTTVRFMADFIYNGPDMWATVLNAISSLSLDSKGRHECDGGGHWSFSKELPTLKLERNVAPPVFYVWAEDQHFSDATNLVAALRQGAANFLKPETKEPEDGYGTSVLPGLLPDEGGLWFKAYIHTSGKEYTAKLICQAADEIERGETSGVVGAGTWEIRPAA